MSRAKKKRQKGTDTISATQLFNRGTRSQPTTTVLHNVNVSRPRHTYSLRARDFNINRSRSPKPRPRRGHSKSKSPHGPRDGSANVEVPATTKCAALPALVISTPCRTRSPSVTPKKYHQSCSPSPRPHTPKARHSPERDFDSYALRHLAQKAIRHSRRYAVDRRLEKEREQCITNSCIPPVPPLKTRHKHYCGQKPCRQDRNVMQVVGNAFQDGFSAFRSMIEDGPLGDSARYCRRRIKRLLRPIWCTCLRHTCLGPPADPIQRHVMTRGRKARDRARNRDLVKKFPRLPTPMPSSPELSSPEPEPSSRAAAQVGAPTASSELQLHPLEHSSVPAVAATEKSPSPKQVSIKEDKNILSLAQLKRTNAAKRHDVK